MKEGKREERRQGKEEKGKKGVVTINREREEKRGNKREKKKEKREGDDMWSRVESRGLLGERCQVQTRFDPKHPHVS